MAAPSRCPALLIMTSRVEGLPARPGVAQHHRWMSLMTLDLGRCAKKTQYHWQYFHRHEQPTRPELCRARRGIPCSLTPAEIWRAGRRGRSGVNPGLVLARIDPPSPPDKQASSASVSGGVFAHCANHLTRALSTLARLVNATSSYGRRCYLFAHAWWEVSTIPSKGPACKPAPRCRRGMPSETPCCARSILIAQRPAAAAAISRPLAQTAGETSKLHSGWLIAA